MLHTHNEGGNALLLREGILFLAQWGVLAGVLFLLLSPTIENALHAVVSTHAQQGLRALGTVNDPISPIQFWVQGKLVEISPLCSGLLEMILLASAMVVTPTIGTRKKIFGIAGGIILLYVFNLFRIIITIQQLVHTSLSFVEFTHDVLFRLVLLLGFAALYGGWLNSARIHEWARQNHLV